MSRIGAKAKRQQTVQLSPERKQALRAWARRLIEHRREQVEAARPLRLTLTSPRTAGHMARGLIVAVLLLLAAWACVGAWWALYV